MKSFKQICSNLEFLDYKPFLTVAELEHAFGCSEKTAYLFLELATKFGYFKKYIKVLCDDTDCSAVIYKVEYLEEVLSGKKCPDCQKPINMDNWKSNSTVVYCHTS